ncbi:erythromycin esterase family protein [Alkanindiges sp. WGS2144]|uniref:erythromycin esterase family protein n=1 Tax=Alkanindiges sp. WGS2144 TaxID=3366808 RepID=UPI0037519E7A
MMATLQQLKAVVHGFRASAADDDQLFQQIGDARFVLIGEASHGTHEFYEERARITQRLIEKKNFSAVVVEADWPDAYRINRYVHGQSDDANAYAALNDFERFPRWMWRNEVMLDFVNWLRRYNAQAVQTSRQMTGFYGMDLYSLHRSMQAVVAYLEQSDADAAKRARMRYGCFDQFGNNPQTYGMATEYGVAEPCEDAVIAQLMELRQQELKQKNSTLAQDEHFYAEQNARLAVNAERYYRAMFRGRDNSWNLRDTHMADTIEALAAHQVAQGKSAKIVIWAHNSHLGDARATEVSQRGQLNVGQLMRERYPEQTFIIGLSTYQGTVLAADDWDSPAKQKKVRPGLAESHEAWLHETAYKLNLDKFWLDLKQDAPRLTALAKERLERYIGVIYAPQTERWSHYLHTRLDQQYDALIYFDQTRALSALDQQSVLDSQEDLPETYPSGE